MNIREGTINELYKSRFLPIHVINVYDEGEFRISSYTIAFYKRIGSFTFLKAYNKLSALKLISFIKTYIDLLMVLSIQSGIKSIKNIKGIKEPNKQGKKINLSKTKVLGRQIAFLIHKTRLSSQNVLNGVYKATLIWNSLKRYIQLISFQARLQLLVTSRRLY